jgi:hypothetical protein
MRRLFMAFVLGSIKKDSRDKGEKQLTYWMLARIAHEHLLEVGRADGQHELVALKEPAIAGNRAVDEIAAVEEALKARRQVFREL